MAIFLVFLMSGCTNMSYSKYSDRYLHYKTQSDTGFGYVPQACMAEDLPGSENYLPPGCANALNLVDMVVEKNDLQHGRKMGPALVSPAVMAVERYLGVRTNEDRSRQEELKRESRTSY